jgi:lipopolysaccharide transport system ATP-binding protein
MSKVAIQVENLSKAYQIGQIGTGTLSRDVDRFWNTKILGKEDPFLKIGETNDRSIKGESDIVWSLKDINFEVNQGDAIGIIGKNGAGKSTLLKLLSRVTSPTTGHIKVKGRIASLLEVGTGFHPELSGRENIYLNGAILGMRKKEITRKLDEIIDFSGVERYVDTPVKRYSSGMYVRLAFAVAAHLESEILIIDEVLAVGDAEFQKKCLGKMGDITKGDGRTVLFVSHNMAAVKSLCNNGIFIENGSIKCTGNIESVTENYLNINDKKSFLFTNLKLSSINAISEVKILTNNTFIETVDPLKVRISIIGKRKKCMIGIALLNNDRRKIFTTICELQVDQTIITCEMPKNLLLEGFYLLDVATFDETRNYQYLSEICPFEVLDLDGSNRFLRGKVGDLKIDCKWF